MTPKDELIALRARVSVITQDIVKLFAARQDLSHEISAVKARGNFAVDDQARESVVVEEAAASVAPSYRDGTETLVRTMIALSKLAQYEDLGLSAGVDFPKSTQLPEGAVAYQGVPGAWSEHAAVRLFPEREKRECEYFEDVMNAVETGRAAIGLLPIENSHTGAIGDTYDLLRRHSCFIVGQIWIRVRQCLLGYPGATLQTVREVYSHPEGLSQSKRFLKNKNWDLYDSRNTAVAAKTVAERADKRLAAIGSRRAAEVYGLDILAEDITDDGKNQTRFIVVAAQPNYSESSDIITATFSVAHRSGALVDTLQALSLSGINLTRIESRPASGGKYRFFIDLEGNIENPAVLSGIARAAAQSEYFEVLGCYSETPEEK